MIASELSENQLVELAATGDVSAVTTLLEQHRERLLQMVRIRMDPRVAKRIDASDVVQDSLLEAHEKLEEYAKKPPLPFYPWLRQIAWQRLMHTHDRHIHTKQRSVMREQIASFTLSNDSVAGLAEYLVDDGTSPSGGAMREESQRRVRAALDELSARDREVLVMRYLEHMSVGEISATLQISENAVRMRQLRALQKLRTTSSFADRENET
jgi:RNA polymerase sigma-70 factor (ECF subfamily)